MRVKLASNTKRMIDDYYKNYDELTAAIRKAGVESMQMVVGIDFSKSNEWTGEKSYGRGLHDLGVKETPYEKALRIMSRIVHEFDEDDIYPVYRFGCINTKSSSVLPLLYPTQEDPHFHGFDEVCKAYRQIAPHIEMSGPTTFAPMIYQAIEICKTCPRQFFLLLLLTDGDVSDMEQDCKAIVDASHYPLAISAIGIGDGPFDKMKFFDDKVKGRKFDNFQFVNMTEVEKKAAKKENPELILATSLIQEVPSQYSFCKKLGYL
ncbi:Copine I [Giardia muris]|uniref:Copine I n=1 Tax=Giardia muris TaxID=5742 RepID=A0A4Z1SN06_GIAMU|nr:Copine I [Giardia muris]|eukprot:TNJ26215.1 Copine I [Giardia muris]